MKKITFFLLLAFSCLNVWAFEHEYPASATDTDTGLKVEINGETAIVTLYKTGAFDYNMYTWPTPVNGIQEWAGVKNIKFVSENGAEYSSNDWGTIQNLFNKFSEGSLSLDCSEMIIADSNFKFQTGTLSYVKMPNGLVDLADGAFEDCTYLSSVGWRPALKTIGDDAFHETAFTSITVPEGVTYIGNQAFSFCPNLTTITLPTTLERIGADPLEGCSAVIAIHSHNKTAPVCEGEICDNRGWDLSNHEFAFYGQCVLYLQPDAATFQSYLDSPIWCKFFLAGSAKICLHTYDTNRPLVERVQHLEVNQTNVSSFDLEGFTTTFHVNTVYQRDMSSAKWYTIMLPFPVGADVVQDVFGNGTKILSYSGGSKVSHPLMWKNVSSPKYTFPFII